MLGEPPWPPQPQTLDRRIFLLQDCHPLCRSAFPEAVVEVGPELRLDDAASIRAFADSYRKQQRPLHVLINNAGANYISEGVTANGVPLLTQVIPQPQFINSSQSILHRLSDRSMCLFLLQLASCIICKLVC